MNKEVNRYIVRVVPGIGNCKALLYFKDEGTLSHIEFIRDGFDKAWINVTEQGLWALLTVTLEESQRIVNSNGNIVKKLHQLEAASSADGLHHVDDPSGLSRRCKVCGKTESFVASLVKKNNGEIPIDQDECLGLEEKSDKENVK